MSEDFFGDLGKSISRATQSAVDRTSNFFESTKISGLIASEQKEIDVHYRKIGEYVVRKVEAGEDVVLDAETLKRVDEIREHLEKILGLKEELAGVRGMRICISCQELIDARMAFCPKCGAPVPVEEEFIEYEEEEELPAVPELSGAGGEPDAAEEDEEDPDLLSELDGLVEGSRLRDEEEGTDAGGEEGADDFTTLDDVEAQEQ